MVCYTESITQFILTFNTIIKANLGKKMVTHLKRLSVILHSKIHFFSNPQIFGIFREKSWVITETYTTTLWETTFTWKESQFFVVGN